MATVDVTVMGAGIFGLSVAYACAARGAIVQVIDPGGVASGASGGLVGALAPHVPENWNDKKQFQLESLLMAPAFWAKVEKQSGCPSGYARTGRLQPVLDEKAASLARQRGENAKSLWQGKAEWRVRDASNDGWHPPSPTGLVIQDSLSALLHPRKATQSLARAIEHLGGVVLANAEPKGKVVWATGWAGIKEVGGNAVKGQAALLDYDAAGQPQLFVDALHIIPHLDGTVAIGSTSEREFDHPTQTDEGLETILKRAYAAMPVLSGAQVIERWAGVRPRSTSRAPVLGAHPHYPGQYIANGGFKIGFGMAPMVGKAMADLVLDGEDTIPQDFKP